MPGLDHRKVSATGRDASSLVLTLPKNWVDGVGIERGATLRVVYDDALVVLPPDASESSARSLLRGWRRIQDRAEHAPEVAGAREPGPGRSP